MTEEESRADAALLWRLGRVLVAAPLFIVGFALVVAIDSWIRYRMALPIPPGDEEGVVAGIGKGFGVGIFIGVLLSALHAITALVLSAGAKELRWRWWVVISAISGVATAVVLDLLGYAGNSFASAVLSMPVVIVIVLAAPPLLTLAVFRIVKTNFASRAI